MLVNIGILLFVIIALVAFRRPVALALDSGLAGVDHLISRVRSVRTQECLVAGTLISPALVLLTAFGLAPLCYAVYLSLYDTRRGIYVAAGNYVRAWHDPEVWQSTLVTFYYAACSIPAAMAISFVVALLLFRIGRARGFFRTVYFLPYVTSAVAAATVWRVLFRPQAGFANVLLNAVGIPGQEWLIEPRGILHIVSGGAIPPTVGPSLALCCIVVFDVWHSCGFMIVIFLAGLSAIPRQLEDSARVDGARPWQVLRHVTIPLLSPTVFFLAVVGAIRAFQSFNSFYALTGGTRTADTQNLVMYIYAQLYENQRYGYGATVAVAMCGAIVVLTAIQWVYVGRRVHYD